MQDPRRRLNRKGVMELPLELMVVMVVLTACIPVVISAMEESEEDIDTAEMDREMERILNAAGSTFYSGSGAKRTVDVRLPPGCEISIGGDGYDAHSMRAYCKGEVVATRYFENPPVCIRDSILVSGEMKLLFECTGEGIGVTVL